MGPKKSIQACSQNILKAWESLQEEMNSQPGNTPKTSSVPGCRLIAGTSLLETVEAISRHSISCKNAPVVYDKEVQNPATTCSIIFKCGCGKLFTISSESKGVPLTMTNTANSESNCEIETKQEMEEDHDDIADFTGSASPVILEPNGDVDVDMDQNDHLDSDSNDNLKSPRLDKDKLNASQRVNKGLVNSQHFEVKQFECQLCGAKYSRLNNCRKHQKLAHHVNNITDEVIIKHDLPPEQVIAPEPDATPPKLSESGPGRNCKEKEKHLKCRFCDNKFSREYLRQCHERSHTGEQPFQCSVCKNSFSHRSTCNRHIKVLHEGKGTTMVTKSSGDGEYPSELSEEAKDKRKKKPFKCAHCKMRFNYLSEKQRHETTHFAVKAYQCGLCGLRVTSGIECRVHQKQVHEVTDGPILKHQVILNVASNGNDAQADLNHPNKNAILPHHDDENGESVAGETSQNQVDMEVPEQLKYEAPEMNLPKIEISDFEVEQAPNLELGLSDPFAHL